MIYECISSAHCVSSWGAERALKLARQQDASSLVAPLFILCGFLTGPPAALRSPLRALTRSQPPAEAS